MATSSGVNPAFERTLGYTSEELLSKPFSEFVHPDDRKPTLKTTEILASGSEITQFENRYIRSDGAERWLQWNARSVPDRGLIYAAARDVTDSRRAREEQAALRRVATPAARGVAPAEVFDAVVAEMRLLLAADITGLLRYEPDGFATMIAASNEPGMEIPLGARQPLEGESISATVWRTGRRGPAPQPRRPAGLHRRRPAAARRVLGSRGADHPRGADVGRDGGRRRKHQPVSGIEDRIVQFTELVATAISNAQAQTDLAASRARIVAASDETRRRIERDLHDGTQQRLVSLGLSLRAAQEAVPPDQAELKQELAEVAGGMAEVLEVLREISRGIHPAILSQGGLGPALKALARRSAVPVKLELGVHARLPERIEVAAYFVVSEALANATKHARASVVRVCADVHDSTLEIVVRDDGAGGADPSRGSGLIGLTDRVEALGGTIDDPSPRRRGDADRGRASGQRRLTPIGCPATRPPRGQQSAVEGWVAGIGAVLPEDRRGSEITVDPTRCEGAGSITRVGPVACLKPWYRHGTPPWTADPLARLRVAGSHGFHSPACSLHGSSGDRRASQVMPAEDPGSAGSSTPSAPVCPVGCQN